METLICKKCKARIEPHPEELYMMCPNGHFISSSNTRKNNLRLADPVKLKEGITLYNQFINKINEKKNTGQTYYLDWPIYIRNVRKGEIVDIEIKKVLKDKKCAFAEVINYSKTIGENDFQRKFNCPKTINSIGFGKRNRKKCDSVIIPDEWEKN